MRFRTTLLLGSAFVAGAISVSTLPRLEHALGVSLLPPALADAVSGDANTAQTYQMLSLFGDVFERVRAEYVDPVTDKKLIENALNGMLTGLDPHSMYMDPKQFHDMNVQTTGQFGGLGIEVTAEDGLVKVISPIDDTPAAKAGIKSGDYIIAVDGKSVEGEALNDVVQTIQGKPGTNITITVKRPNVNKPLVFPMTREVIKIQVVKSQMEPDDVGYIRISQFTEQTDPGLHDAYAALLKQAGGKLKGLVLDLRNNPGGLLDQAIAVSDDFIPDGEIVSTRARNPDDSQRWNARGEDMTHGLPIVVLTNAGTASASEIVSGALQDHRRAVVLGTQTFGKGSVQTVIPLPDGGGMRLTTARYYTPSGRSIQGLGITPDVDVHESDEAPIIEPQREADLKGAISNVGGAPQATLPPRTDLPAIVKDIPAKPPKDWPAFDASKPTTDFQLQEALKVLAAMQPQPRAAN